MGILDQIAKGYNNAVLGPDPSQTADAYSRLQQELSSKYDKDKQIFAADPANAGQQYKMPDPLTRWQEQVDAMIKSGNPVLQKEGLSQLSMYQQRATAATTTEAPSSVKEYQYAQGQGYQGSYQQWVLDKAAANKSSFKVTVNPTQQLLGLKDSMGLVNEQGEHPPVGIPLGDLPTMGYRPMLNDTQRQAGTAGDVLKSSTAGLGQNLDTGGTPATNILNELRTAPGTLGSVADSLLSASGIPMTVSAVKFNNYKTSVTQQTVKIMSGASATEGEMATYRGMMPKFTDDPETKRIKFQQAQEFANSVVNRNAAAGVKPSESKPADWSTTKSGHKYRIVE
jgi:hypothetical protein